MWMIAANFWRTHSPSRLAWFEGWRPPGAQSTFISYCCYYYYADRVITQHNVTIQYNKNIYNARMVSRRAECTGSRHGER